ncbi:hypothetical protein [Micromonospora sp. IBHARD004]|uniref:hypothetical protein n=1 Tax=Micromonospora sp. IBHARD004 TaxID=3457764 RepID=UPI004059A3BD
MNNVRALIVLSVVAAVLAIALIVIGLQGKTGLRAGFCIFGGLLIPVAAAFLAEAMKRGAP